MPTVQSTDPAADCTPVNAGARRSWHPLELIPFFARWSPSPLRDFIYAFIWNTLMALIFTAFAALFSDGVNLQRQFVVCFIFAQFIGYAIWMLYVIAGFTFPATRRRNTAIRWVYFFVIPTLGVFIGYWLAAWTLDWGRERSEMFTARGMLSIFMVSVIITSILVAIFIPRERAAEARARAAHDEARANAAEREATLARMQLLEAQIEPHFLYNTLAHVVSLIDAEPAVAKRMLDRLIVLLRATAASANRSSTLGAQLDLLRAYLDIIALRMGSRLAWSIDVAPRARSACGAADAAAADRRKCDQARARAQDRRRPRRYHGAAQWRRARVDGCRYGARCKRDARRALDGVGPCPTCAPGSQRSTTRRRHSSSPTTSLPARASRFPYLFRMAVKMTAGRTTAIIADDEPRLAEYLKARLAVLWPELVIAGVAGNGPDAQALLVSEAPDIAFLDIRMPGLSGLDVARTADRQVQIVFVTAYDEYALAAFERAAVDYLLKPVSDERLAETVARLQARSTTSAPAPDLQAALDVIARLVPGGAGTEKLAWIRASAGQQVRLIAVEDVCYFQANDKYTSVFTAEGEALIRTPLKELAGQLDAQRFWQVHRGTIVNVRHIATTLRDLTGRVTLTLKSRPEKVAVSRAYAHLFKQM